MEEDGRDKVQLHAFFFFLKFSDSPSKSIGNVEVCALEKGMQGASESGSNCKVHRKEDSTIMYVKENINYYY